MSYTPPEDPAEPGKGKRPSNGRIVLWVGVAAVGLYFLISGIIGIVTH